MSSHSRTVQYAQTFGKCLMHRRSDYSAYMTDKAERLRIARLNAGFASAYEAANALGVNKDTYSQHENGIRGYPAAKAELYSRRFKVSAEWLLFGKGTGPAPSTDPSEDDLEAMLADVLREIPAGATIGDWPRIAAPILRAQLERYRVDREGLDSSHGKNALVEGAQSPASTKPDAEA